MQTRNILDVLPVELAVAVLGYVDHKDVLHFRLCSRACDQLVKTGQEQIHESIAHRILRVGTPTTAGDSGITPTTILPQEEECSDGSSTAGTLSPLKQAIANQRTASTVFQSVTTWTELVKLRVQIDRNWRIGVPSKRYISPNSPRHLNAGGGISVWRFKVCPRYRVMMASTTQTAGNPGGAVYTVSLSQNAPEGHELELAIPERPYIHIEYTNGYLIYVDDNSVVNVRRWRPAGESGDVDDEAEEGLPGKILTRVVRIEPPSPITSYKARYPYLVGEALDAGKMFLFDVRDGRLVKSVNIPVVNINSYVELDAHSLFQANVSVIVTDGQTGAVRDLLDPRLYLDEGSEDTLRTSTTVFNIFSAIHHSLDGQHLIAVNRAGQLVWFRDYRKQRASVEDNRNSLVVLECDDTCVIDNVCVENNRVVFSVQRHDRYPVLYLFELSAWNDLEDFDPPTVRILSGAVPTGGHGISRIEMDSTCVYLTANGAQLFQDSRDFEAVRDPDSTLKWYSITGGYLGDSICQPVFPQPTPDSSGSSSTASGTATNLGIGTPPSVESIVFTHRVFNNNTVLVYDFAACV